VARTNEKARFSGVSTPNRNVGAEPEIDYRSRMILPDELCRDFIGRMPEAVRIAGQGSSIPQDRKT
jgi:hypothetical protein